MFSLNSMNLVIKKFVIAVKGFQHVTSYVRDQVTTTEPAKHI